VEAVPKLDASGKPYEEKALKAMHTTMQTLGRMAVIGGFALVALANVYFFHGTELLPREQKAELYARIFTLALIIPVLSVAGVVLHAWLRAREAARLRRLGQPQAEVARAMAQGGEKTRPNWWILGGSLVFVALSLAVGLGRVSYAQELVFAGSMAVILFLLWRLVRELDAVARETLVATALVIFVFRATPSTGAGYTWWIIDVLKFDESFLARLSLLAYAMTLVGMFALRGFMSRNSIGRIVVVLTLAGTLLTLPNLGMYYGLHEWTARHTGGVVDARVIALIDTALESPLGQIAMIPMLAWIANTAPTHLKATYFAVMASFSNLALSASQLGTKYLNQIFSVTREVRDRASGAVKGQQDYSELGVLLITVVLIALVIPLATVWIVHRARLRTA
jgi:hypothetical protein